MAADVNFILIAWDGLQDEDHALKTHIYGAQGIRVKPRDAPAPGQQYASDADIKAWAAQHNRRMAAAAKAAAKKAAAVDPSAKPPPKAKAGQVPKAR